ncbi:MAG: hypothetical protein ACYTEL_18330 [Planctomycetota bacterium]|jgi:hypothetical protein
MDNEKLGKLLSEFGRRTAEPVRPGLAEEIKEHIPAGLARHRRGMNTVSIMIDLRVGKLTAAAAIIITTVLLASFLSSRSSEGGGVLQDVRVLTGYLLGGAEDNISTGKSQYEYLLGQGKEAVFYGENVDASDSNSILMHLRLSQGKYRVLFVDLREQEVSAEELVRLQARMLQRRKN